MTLENLSHGDGPVALIREFHSPIRSVFGNLQCFVSLRVFVVPTSVTFVRCQ